MKDELEIRKIISKIICDLGIPAHLNGYKYIREAIFLRINNPNIENFVTKQIYPEIAMKYKTLEHRVERAIRHAIERGWERGNSKMFEEIFGHSKSTAKKPTNGEFIATIAEKIFFENINNVKEEKNV